MQLLPLNRLGTREIGSGIVRFGILLPWVSASDGNQLSLKIIHESDQFLQDIQPTEFPLDHSIDPAYGDYWSTEIVIRPEDRANARSAWGTPGTYVYRYQLRNPNTPRPIDWIIDPFAREFGVGQLSAFTLGYQPYQFSASEAGWKTPQLEKLIMYELMLAEFGDGVEGSIEHLPYLADLGVNCIEVMPVSNVDLVTDWGYLPLGYFGVDERFGNRKDFQRFVDVAHQNGIAVILDSVYGHTSEHFPYQYVYSELGYHENPFMGHFAADYFGCSTDFNRGITRDFFFTVNHHWLDVYHVDGFRYDCVPNFWDGPMGNGYSNLTYNTYQTAKTKVAGGEWQRFIQGADISLIQCAEQLEDPTGVLWQTYSNCTWQNGTLSAATDVAHGNFGRLSDLGQCWGMAGYPSEVTHNQDTVRKTALQYIENHDHSRFICNFGIIRRDNDLLSEGDRDKWYELQPYLIGHFTAKGIPMLWQGQEFVSNSLVPESGLGRVMMFRPVRWDYFYDQVGRNVLRLVRGLVRLRCRSTQLQTGDHYFYNDWGRYQSRGLLLFSRSDSQRFTLVALNFSGADQWAPFWFPRDGFYREELHGEENFTAVSGQEHWLQLPGHYGRVWTIG